MNDKERETPSQSCQSVNYWRRQAGKCPVLDGRYASVENTIPPPVEIYHPVFAAFIAESRNRHNLVIPEDFLRQVPILMHMLSQIRTLEASSEEEALEMLWNLLKFSVVPLRYRNRVARDHGIIYSRHEGPAGAAALAIVENKPELGSGNDGAVQGSFSYVEHWTDRSQLVRSRFN